ncbi:MAG: hypothetical protein K2K41_07470 [Ruminiclostridium sp.]|nr:hypothetical protein [Ruminiclostridium sp.]
MKIKKLITAILLCAVLAGCSNTVPSHEIPLENSNCPISTMRTGTERQGIKSMGNGFECTQDGSYFMYDEFGGGSWLLYIDHGSDTVFKLCGRPDCTHTDSECNAFFKGAYGICYYDGFLYTININQENPFDLTNKDIIRMNLDGTERTVVYNTANFAHSNKYENIVDEKIFNGVLFFMAGKLNEDGVTIFDSGFYKLDGSMDEPKLEPFFAPFLFADGESFVGNVDYDEENELWVNGIWDPNKGIVEELYKADNLNAYGYIGTKAHYYVENGVIIEDSYTEGKKELIDTGLKGDYQLACFPDCMALYEKGPYEEKTIYFYD